MQYAYAWYEMFGIMLGAGVAIFLVVKGIDLALDRLLNVMAARRDRKLAQEIGEVAPLAAEAMRQFGERALRLSEHYSKRRNNDDA